MGEPTEVELETLRNKTEIPEDDSRNYTGVLPPARKLETKKENQWQKVVQEISRKGTHLYEPVKSIPSPFLLLLLGLYLLVGYLTQLVEDDMVRVVPDNEIASDDWTRFSEESALRYLDMITGDQPRVAGTRYHLNRTRELKTRVDELARAARLPVHTLWQNASSDFILAHSPAFVKFYQNVSNIVAVLEGQAGFHGNELGDSVLVNCHYDSVPFALGVSDNALFCAIMFETLTRMAKRTTRFKNNVIFLFNGAEENGLLGSHAFLQHPWSKAVREVVNLDAAGMNGKATLFQSTDPRVLSAYRRSVDKPNAQSFGEYMFTSGIIPSDTDFRIWRDFGQIYGVDIAFTKWGHVYHTRYDTRQYLRAGVAQCAGDMLLALLADLADSDDVARTEEPTAMVYYDYLNWFMVSYSVLVSYIVDVCAILMAVLSVAYYVWIVGLHCTTVEELMHSALSRLLCLSAGLAAGLLLMVVSVATTVQMRYLTQPWIVVAIFWIPYLIVATTVSHYLDAWRVKKNGMNRSVRAAQAQAATRLLLAVAAVPLLAVPAVAATRYLLTLPLAVMSATSVLGLSVMKSVKREAWRHLLLEFLLSLPCVMFCASVSLRVDALLVPVLGRSPLDRPDCVVGYLNLALVALAAATVSGLELLFSRKRLWMVCACALAACLVVVFVPMQPYQDEGPAVQRHYWFHSEIVSHNYNGEVTDRVSGVLITKHDVYTIDSMLSALRAKGISLSTRTDFDKDCESKLFCDLPLYRPMFGKYLSSSLFLYTFPPAPTNPPPSLAANRTCSGEMCTLYFTLRGPAHNLVTLWPRAAVVLSGWSLASPLQPAFNQSARPVYLLSHSVATLSQDNPAPVLNFQVTLTVPISLQTGAIIDVSLHANRIHHPEDNTAEYNNLVAAMPKYFNIATFLSNRLNYEF